MRMRGPPAAPLPDRPFGTRADETQTEVCNDIAPQYAVPATAICTQTAFELIEQGSGHVAHGMQQGATVPRVSERCESFANACNKPMNDFI